MFVKVQDPTFASALNISKFDAITIRRTQAGYALSAYIIPFQGEYHDIAVFGSLEQAKKAFDSLMTAIANGEHYWG